MQKLRNYIVLCAGLWLLAGLFVPVLARAQAPDPVQYIVAPETPGPNSPVQIEVQGVGAFLGNANISWSVGGKTIQSGVGLTDFSFTTGGLGTQSVVRVSINSDTQGLITHTFTFTPSTVQLIWESDTTVPPRFMGKALYSAGSPLRIITFPTVIVSGKKVAQGSLSYQWSVNDEPLPENSGTGKYILSYTGDQLQTVERIAVDVYFGSLKVGHGEIVIPATEPQIVFYSKDPLRGVVWEQALPTQGIALNSKEITLQAEPFFFSRTSYAQNALAWDWSLNGTPITGPYSNQGLMTLRQSGTGEGSATLAVALQNQESSKLLQSATANLRIVFGTQTGSALSSFFGL